MFAQSMKSRYKLTANQLINFMISLWDHLKQNKDTFYQ